jgi:autotransporter-associated beta strand protein
MRPRFLSARRGAFLSTTALAGAMLFAAVAAMPALADGGAGGNGATGGGTAGSGGAGGTGFTAPNNNGGNSTAGAGGGGAGGGGGGAAGGGHGGDGCAGLCPANGGAGGTALNPNGQDGAAGSAGGGGGGGGGYNGNGAGASTITNTSALAGGNGGAGGAAAGVNGGGGGGAGGYGAVVTGSGGSSNSASITGGNGGIGGAAGGAPGVHAGNGGDGGVGVQFTSTGATFTNSGSITGGNGGAGGSGSGGGIAGTPGAGGVGIVGAGLTVINSGTISGGLAGGGARANAITFTGGTNTLELRAGFSITGNVVAASTADTLALGGTTNASFDVSKIGSSAQYQGFGNFQKTGTSTWTLIGTTAAVTPWTINAGTLAVSSDANLGDPGGGLSFNGGTLQFLSGFTTNRGITLNAGGGTFDTNGNNGTLAGNIVGTGGLTKIGAGTLTLSGPSTYTGATNVNAGTLQAGVANAFAPLSAFTIASGATLDLNNFDQAVGSLAGAGAVTLGAATLFTGGDNTSTTFAGTISGSGALFKLGPGTLALTGTSTYSGGTMIAGGLVNFNAASNFGTGLILLNGGGLQWAAGTSLGPRLSRGRARLHQPLDVDRPLRLCRRPPQRELQRAVVRRAGGKRLSLRHHLWRAHALRGDPDAELPRAVL